MPDNMPAPESPAPPPPLYAKQQKIFPRRVKGIFRTVKTVSLWLFLCLYYLTPWLRWDRGPGAPNQAVLMDIDGRRGHIFAIEIWPQEVYYLTGLLVLAAIGLFFATSLFGRVWCGFACFQTVYTDLFMMVERLFQGDRNKAIKLHKAPWSMDTLAKKGATHAVWLLISAATAYTFVLYFSDAFEITREVVDLTAGPWILSSIGFLTFTTYLFAGFAREQVCIYMCPYARFQGAMMDENSMIVTYESWRGDPKDKASPGQNFTGRGHCVDCRVCVHACPTGIDIRDGSQLECIGCALCVDACDSVMDRFKLPRGLITYDSESNQRARAKGGEVKNRLIRPRTFAYIALITFVIGIMVVSLSFRSTLEVNVLRDRAPLFVTLSNGSVRNGYTFKVLNMVREKKTYTLQTEGLEGLSMRVIGFAAEGSKQADLTVKPDRVGSFRVFLKARPETLTESSTNITLLLEDHATGKTVRHDTVFIGPKR